MSTWATTLDTLVRERGQALFGYAYVLTGDRHTADDLVQDAIVRTFRKGRGNIPLNAAHAYVKRAMLTAFIDGRRRAKTRPALVNDDMLAADAGTGGRSASRHAVGGPGVTGRGAGRPGAGAERLNSDSFTADPTRAADTRMDLYAAILTLPPRQRACLVMRYVDGLNAASIARELGLAAGTVRKYLSEAVGTLRDRAPQWAHDHDDVVEGGAEMAALGEIKQTGAQR